MSLAGEVGRVAFSDRRIRNEEERHDVRAVPVQERRDGRHDRDDHAAEGTAVKQAVIERMGIGAQHGEAGDRDRTREDPGPERAGPKACDKS